jgi:hypothetical protein
MMRDTLSRPQTSATPLDQVDHCVKNYRFATRHDKGNRQIPVDSFGESGNGVRRPLITTGVL